MNQAMRGDLNKALEEILIQSQAVVHQANNMQISAYRMQDPHGNFVLAPLLIMKAQLLIALAQMDT